jgi:hypothetical protein
LEDEVLDNHKVSENRHLSEDKEIYVPENESEAYQLEKYG